MMKMRRHDREVTDINKINEFIKTAPFMNVGINTKSGAPYIVALNYGYEIIDNDIILYFHCAKQGRKTDLLKENNLVSVHITSKSDLMPTEKAEDFSCEFASVYLEGVATPIEDSAQKKKALDLLMINAGFTGELSYPENLVKITAIYKIVCKDYTAKSRV